jgi:aspartokinase
MSENLTQLAAEYIAGRPSIKECLSKGLVNHSALAREICRENRIRKVGAVIAACRRYQARLRRQGMRDASIRSLVQHAKLRVRTKMCSVSIPRPADLTDVFKINLKVRRLRGDFVWIESDEILTLATNMESLPLVHERFGPAVLSERMQLAMITIIFDPKIETTAGVVSFIYGLLAEHGINIVGETSLGNDVMILISERELPTALKVLNLDEQVS